MRNIVFIVLLLLSVAACKTNGVKQKKVASPNPDTLLLPPGKIEFDFNLGSGNNKSKNYASLINATLLNAGTDTAYFVSWSCEGLINDIVYDTASLSLFGFVVCNTSFPKIITIAPGKKIEMRACFMFLKPETYINLGYSFNRVKKEFNINNTSHMTAYWKSRGKYILRTGQRAIQ